MEVKVGREDMVETDGNYLPPEIDDGPTTAKNDADNPATAENDAGKPTLTHEPGITEIENQNINTGQSLRCLNRIRIPSHKATNTSEFLYREQHAKGLGEEWAKETTVAKGNLATSFALLVEVLPNEVGSECNVALMAVGLPLVPKTYDLAMKDPERWIPAIENEKSRMQEFSIFGSLQDPPLGATILNPLWVFAHKLDGMGNIIDEKA
ncbi:hypothetical protein DFH05DRAFT_1525930 [Lentinula detonsa]|uniref:Uncharacterized protein n=1 Tax=Lentinula detonsa TaxID=2804962 RepID=A0A9W8NZ27_9AGAR|nr:hypothetical protein DFH05DRAFT_1525930 [Lentinula detonsa]